MSDNIAGFISENIFLISLASGLIVFILINESKRAFCKFEEIGPEEAVKLLNHKETVMLDVRESNELSTGTIRDAKRYPASTFSAKLTELEAHKDHPVVAFCSNGLKAVKICNVLTKNGFQHVYHLKGGLTGWVEANLPVVKE